MEKELTLRDKRFQRICNMTPEEDKILDEWKPDTEDLKTIWSIIEYSGHGIPLNANDFFAYACSESLMLDTADIHWALPIVRKYSYDGINAVMSYIADKLPITPHITENFNKALEEIKELDPIVFSD